MLTLTHASFATIEELFQYKFEGFALEPFPGYTPDQWGIKAHNRPWIAAAGEFTEGQRVLEVGGAYSLLLEHLALNCGVESWVVDDFGTKSDELFWARWSDPHEYAAQHPNIRYVFERLGDKGSTLPEHHFHRIISVSTLEHVPEAARTAVFKEAHKLLAPGGIELHTIDIAVERPARVIADGVLDWLTPLWLHRLHFPSEIRKWISHVADSGVKVATTIPNSWALLDRRTLVESPDVVFRFYPPNDAPKEYHPSASLLLVIQDL